ncbi:MAG: acyl carrier protein [Thermoanaerobaculia bacterium]|nr:acyl carrier protein [Thermoanaerobaculia bacterium]
MVPTRDEILASIRELGPEESQEEIRLDSRLVEDLDLDSVGLLTLAVEVEDRFRICLDPEDEDGIRTVGDLVGVVEEKLRE